MKTIKCSNYEEVSKNAAKIVAQQILLKSDSVLGLPTGSTWQMRQTWAILGILRHFREPV